MKMFWSTLAAILVAAAIIFTIRGCVDAFDDLARSRAETQWAKEKSEALRKQTAELEAQREKMMRDAINRLPDSPAR